MRKYYSALMAAALVLALCGVAYAGNPNTKLTGQITAIKQTVLAGFIHGDYFYTRAQAAAADLH